MPKKNLLLNNKGNNPIAQHSIQGQALPTDCYSHVHLSADRGERSSSYFRGDMWSERSRYWLSRPG